MAYVADSTPSSIPGVGSLRLHRILLDRFDEASALATRYVQPEPALHFIPTGLALDEGWLYLAGMRDLDAGQFASALYRARVDGFDSGKELQLEELVDLDPYPERRLVIHRGGAYMPSPAGLERVDLEPPFARTSIQLGSTGGATAVLAAGDHLLAATDDGGLHFIDISAYPGVLSMPAGSVPGRPVDLAISAGRLWVATAEAGLFGLVDRSCATSLRESEHCRWVGGKMPSGLLDVERTLHGG